MKYFGFMPNDFINGKNVSVSLWTSGCPHHCEGCHNPEMWDPNNGYEVPADLNERLIKAITANGLTRNFSILGGEPMAPYNTKFVADTLRAIRQQFPHIVVFLWSGYTLDALQARHDADTDYILENITVLIDGPFILSQRDITLDLRGSTNQRVLHKGVDF